MQMFHSDLISITRAVEITTETEIWPTDFQPKRIPIERPAVAHIIPPKTGYVILFNSWGTAKRYRARGGLWKVTFVADHIPKSEYDTNEPYNDILRDIKRWVSFMKNKYNQSIETLSSDLIIPEEKHFG